MAKKGQHHNSGTDSAKPRGHEKARGHNNPSQSQTITTGTYKKKETYAKRAREHKHPEPVAQAAQHDWNDDTRDKSTIEGSVRARDSDLSSGRSGSDSNAS